jgi:hypothetical protein
MSSELISVRDVATQHGKLKQTVFKVLKRLGIAPTKQRSSTGKNQIVSYITREEFQLLSAELALIPNASELVGADDHEGFVSLSDENGVFYLLQLEPEHDPKRFKVGFAVSMPERLRQLRCSAPFASLVKSWPCRRLWERTAIDCVSAGCERLHTEVFRAASIDEVAARCERFFALMPPCGADCLQPRNDPGATVP